MYKVISGHTHHDRLIAAADIILEGSITQDFEDDLAELVERNILYARPDKLSKAYEAEKVIIDFLSVKKGVNRVNPVPTDGGSILTEAEDIVNGARAADYGSAKASFGKIAKVAELIACDDDTPAVSACKVLIAVKLVRESHKHKRDNLVDLAGYAELLNRLHEQ